MVTDTKHNNPAAESITQKNAKTIGVSAKVNKKNVFQYQRLVIEMLVGGPYKDHPYGHVALRVVAKDKEFIYDFGRYGATWGTFKSEGEGIINIWTNFSAYISEENSLGRVTTGFVYSASDQEINKIIKYFDALIAGKKARGKSPTKSTYRIDTDYHALRQNCTILSVVGIKQAFPDFDKNSKSFIEGRGLGFAEKTAAKFEGWPNHIFMPADLQAYLESNKAKPAEKVNKYGGK